MLYQQEMDQNRQELEMKMRAINLEHERYVCTYKSILMFIPLSK